MSRDKYWELDLTSKAIRKIKAAKKEGRAVVPGRPFCLYVKAENLVAAQQTFLLMINHLANGKVVK